MREREREQGNSRALWDPLWEYILDDHESVDEAANRKSRSRSLRRQQKLEREPSLLDVFFDKDSSTDSDDEELRYDTRDERTDQRRSSKISSSNRRSQLTEDSGVDNSLWDFLGGREQTKAKQDSSARQQTRQVIQTDAASEKTSKKSGLFRRFRREEKTGNTNKKKREVRVTVTEASKPAQSSSKAHPANTQSSQKEEHMDPFQMFMEVASKLDPFASEESDSEESYTATREDAETDGNTDFYTEGTESVAEMNDSSRQATNINEIRLNFTPIRYKSGKEGYRESRNSIEEEREDLGSDHLEENDLVASAPRARIDGTGAISALDPIADDIRDVTSFRDAVAFEPVLDDDVQSSQARDKIDTSTRAKEKDLLVKRFDLKRLICCSAKKRHDGDTLDSFPTDMAKHTFPSTRMVSDNGSEYPKVMTESMNQEHGLGFPSDQFEDTKGPQSVYAYDYQNQEHLDVFYTAMGTNPRNSIVVRKLGGPPLLIPSSMRNEVIIQIEASTVSETDCIIRQGYWWRPEMAPLANTPGVEVVGKVFQVKPQVGIQYGLLPTQRVLCLTKWGGNSRYMALDPAKLVKVPDAIDPAEATCLPETYLTAFQVLHFGQVGQTRYEKSSLRGKSVLIVGSMANNLGKAIIELALDAGVANIYATAKKKHWKTLISFGIMPLSQEPLEWISRVEGTIDLVLASNGGLREDITPIHYQALRPRTGRLIKCGQRVVGNDLPTGDWESSPASLVCTKQKELTKMMHRSHSYDVYEQWDRRLDLCKRDLEHLLGLLQQGIIKPKILDRIPLSKVARAHELLETKRLSGFLICEPWMRSKKRAVYL